MIVADDGVFDISCHIHHFTFLQETWGQKFKREVRLDNPSSTQIVSQVYGGIEDFCPAFISGNHNLEKRTSCPDVCTDFLIFQSMNQTPYEFLCQGGSCLWESDHPDVVFPQFEVVDPLRQMLSVMSPHDQPSLVPHQVIEH